MIKRYLIPAGIFLTVLMVYYSVNPHPTGLFQHFVLMADSFLKGHLDIVNKPWHYGDYLTVNNKIYFQYAPAPALVFLPFVFLWKTAVSQTYFSMIFGALNCILVYILLGRIKITGIGKRLFLTTFFAFGTVHFSASVTGTTWFFEHITAVFFLLLALIENFGKRRPMILGLLFSFAVFSRQTVFLSLPFFILYMKKDVSSQLFIKKLLLFAFGAAPLFLFNFYYNFVRFGSIFDDGRYFMYLNYVNSDAPYTFMRLKDPSFKTGMLDLKNIPLNLYTLFLMPPVFSREFPYVSPSPHGMSIIITSPLIFYALRARLNFLVKSSYLAALLTLTAASLWFAQGWVQFGYRYTLDFLPFLIILLGLGLGNITPFKLLLFVWSVLVNTWGAFYLKV